MNNSNNGNNNNDIIQLLVDSIDFRQRDQELEASQIPVITNGFVI